MRALLHFAMLLLCCVPALLRSRNEQTLVELALRQQLAIYAQRRPRPRITPVDRSFWILLSRFWPGWKDTLIFVQPEPVVRWHRAGFRLYWRSISQRGSGRPPVSAELRGLIRRFATENGWGARKVHAELEKLGFTISLATVSRYLIHDNDSIFSTRLIEAIGHLGLESKPTAYRSPWQNGTAERWVGTVRRELLDHVIVLDERHLRRLLREYVDYYNDDRVHTPLRDSPTGRPTEDRPSLDARIVGLPRVGGLHHRYAWREAA